MSNFYIAAIGTRPEVLGQLKNAPLQGSLLAEHIRDAVIEAVVSEVDSARQGFEGRYNISIMGHEGKQDQPPVLSVTIQSRYIPKADAA